MEEIILIDDDKRLCDKLKKYFKEFSLDLHTFTNPLDGIKNIEVGDYKVLILDGMMPDMDGFEVCKKVREFSQIPIVFLTGRVDEADKILGLEFGADDYITKPFSPRELVARIKSQLRRVNQQLETKISGNDLELNTKNYTAAYKGQEIKLTATEFEILHYLESFKGEVKTREEIMQGLYGDTWESFDRSLDISISRIRKKLKEIVGDKEFIKTVRLKGYIFVDND